MSELSGTAAVGIESVEWLDAGAGNLTVRITGRWRRRRGRLGDTVPTHPTMLVVEAEGHRHRFPAMPEPPSVDGAAPGMWRLSFSLPASIAPRLGGAWLAFGTVTVPLPIPESGGREDAPAVAETPAAVAPDESATIEAPSGTSAPGFATPPDDGPALEIERAWRRAEDAETASAQLTARLAELESALAGSRRDHEEIVASLAARERGRRVAEQRAHAEEAMRRDLARQLAASVRETAQARQSMGDLATAEDRIRELEGDLRSARRAGDEAEQAAAAALAARERAERLLHEQGPVARRPAGVTTPSAGGQSRVGDEHLRLAFEDALRAHHAGAGSRVPAEPAAIPMAARALSVTAPAVTAPPAALEPRVGESELVTALRRELDGRARTEAGLRARMVTAESRLAARVLLEQRTTQTLRELRAELERLGVALTSERDGRRAAEAEVAKLRSELGGQRDRSQGALAAIGELRGALEALRPPEPSPPADADEVGEGRGSGTSAVASAPGSAGSVDPQALSAALSRLRAQAEPREVEPEDPVVDAPVPAIRAIPASAPSVTASVTAPAAAVAPVTSGLRRPTIELGFRRLAARDADAAGRLLLGLLPCQRAAYPHPVSYDLVLGPGRGCVQVTAGLAAAEVSLQGAARAREQVDFQVIGDPARLARLLTASPLRRLLRVGIARVRGRREGLAAIRALLALPLDLTSLQRAGLRADGETVLRLVAAMVEPAWTHGESFTVAYDPAGGEPVFLTVADGRAPAVSRARPAGRVAATITGSPAALAGLLSGFADPGMATDGGVATVTGDRGPLEQLRSWANRARG